MNIQSKKIAPLLTTLLLGGLIVSCSTTSSSVLKNAQNYIKSKQYDSTLAEANRFLQKHPGNAEGYFYKGEALGLKASDTSKISISTPKKATPLYKQMAQAFDKAKQIGDTMSKPPSVLQRIDPVRTSLWRTEHNLGVNYARKDSLHNTVQNPLEVAIGHLQNATIAQPDCAISWNALAQVNGLKQNYKQAAAAQQKYLSMADSTTSRNYLVLAQYYNRSNQPKKALPVLEKAHQQYPDSIKTVEMLADTYSKLGQSDKSINLVKELVQKNPSNGRYRMSLGTQIYQKEIKLQHKYDSNSDSLLTLQNKKTNASGDQADQIQDQMNQLQEQNADLKKQMDDLTQRALKQLHEAQNDGQNGANVYFTLGVIYQNKASVLYEQRNLTLDNDKANQLNEQARAQLKKARDYYKQAAQIDPDNKKYWRSLYQIYTGLGNDQKAQEAKQKAGIQQ
jgi:predicted Zn-dependent protease